MNKTVYQNRTNLHLESHDYRIYYVNIDLRHQYGISVAESQTFLLAKRPQRRGARRNGCFRRLVSSQNNYKVNRIYSVLVFYLKRCILTRYVLKL